MYRQRNVTFPGETMMQMERADFANILRVLDESTEMNLASCRGDGFPQASTVNFIQMN